MDAALRLLKAGLLGALIATAQPCLADAIDGHGDPAFISALDQWVSGDEATALPNLAALAQADNMAAQMLLGLIDASPALQGDWLMALPREDRIALMRAPGGLSGLNWMQVAATKPQAMHWIAEAWMSLRRTDATPNVILQFGGVYEPRAARLAAMTLAKREVTGFAAIADDLFYPPSARAFAIREWQRTDPPRAQQEAAKISADDPQGEILGLRSSNPAAWLAANPEGDPLVALCAAACPDVAQPTCLNVSYTALGGYWPLMALGSPIERMIPSERFNRSPVGLRIVTGQLQGADTGLACLNDARH